MMHAPLLRRWLPILVLIAGFAAVFAFDLDRFLTLDALKAHRAAVESFAASHRLAAVGLYALAYVLVVALSLPGGAVMTILGGFLFGVWLGGAVTVLAATTGAAILFLAARTALGDVLARRAGPWLARMEAGFRANATSYMLVLRLVPLFPFFIVNLAPAFLNVPFRTYVWTTLVGIMPGTLVYTAIGNGLGALLDAGQDPDLGLIFRPAILGPLLGLAALALVPVLYKRWKAKTHD